MGKNVQAGLIAGFLILLIPSLLVIFGNFIFWLLFYPLQPFFIGAFVLLEFLIPWLVARTLSNQELKLKYWDVFLYSLPFSLVVTAAFLVPGTFVIPLYSIINH